jgi:hypothetical protein
VGTFPLQLPLLFALLLLLLLLLPPPPSVLLVGLRELSFSL